MIIIVIYGGLKLDNSLLLFILLLFIRNSRFEESRGLMHLSDYIKSIKIEPQYTLEKIKLLKRVGPYFPEEYIPTINKSILITERIIKINELANFMKNSEYKYIKEHVPVESNKERLSKIINIVQKEMPRNEVNDIGMVVDLIVNMDKYKKMFSMLNSLMSNEEALKDPSQLLSIAGPLMGIDTNKDSEKMKEINKMMEIFKMLNSPKKEASREGEKSDGKSDNEKNHLKSK